MCSPSYYKRTIRITVCILMYFFSSCFAATPDPELIANGLEKRIQQAHGKQAFTCADELLCGVSIIPKFYKNRDYMPLWVRGEGFLNQTKSIISELSLAGLDGLRPEDYHVASLKRQWNELTNHTTNQNPLAIESFVNFELMLTDGFLMFASHLAGGRVNPESIHSKWFPTNHVNDFTPVLDSAAEADDIGILCENLRPPHEGYQALKMALARYRDIAAKAPLPSIPDGRSLKKNESDPRIPLLKKRLAQIGDLTPPVPLNQDVFDDALEKAVRRFQYRHGLGADGIVGADTIRALNTPLPYRLRQIKLNLERWRWIPRNLGYRHLLINIADFKLKVIENRETMLEMRVVVGKTYRKTPVFSGAMKYLVLNPQWHVPTKIAVEDLLPKIKKDPQFLVTQHFKIFNGWQKGAAEINSETINWSQLNEDNFSFKLIQGAGPRNALGRIKFMCPNKFAVYLHDTPQRSLFERAVRGFSSGCIRVEKAIDLAEYVLSDDDQWTKEDIKKAISTGERKVIVLKKRIPVHIVYRTAWVSPDGILHFRSDIYERDNPLDKALQERLVGHN